ncbi:N-acetyl-1-D-myo-inositol-2-amino-2-deoxy-alpha-D-glucopyranoside deacetylase [Streptomyces olivaceus]|uniref:N-acetyl-1-D-myo-inositol-2-amino-2-deoxy-alpha- D-glucopyranoside deacetylase n=1 Tax=Streptomyces olivaceus TaxID=47716 RepID=UPI0033C30A66
MTELPGRRLLLVHAHPDDESINNGVTMARYAAEGAHVTLVTCTLGERGEVIPPELAHLSGAALGGHRRGELAEAMRALGVGDFRLLGGPGRFSDSGMTGLADNDAPGCLWQADVDAAAALLVDVIREVRPQVLVTYDPDGGYGHPDHVQAHRIAMRAVELAAEAGCPVAKVYWNRVPRSWADAAFARLRDELPGLPFEKAAGVEDVPGVVDDERITTEIHGEGTEYAAAKAAAMRAHATQITVAGDCFVLSNDLAQPIITTEYYELVRGERGVGDGREHDLFAGISGGDATEEAS